MAIRKAKQRIAAWTAALMLLAGFPAVGAPSAAEAAEAPVVVPLSVQLNNMDSAADSAGDTVGTAGIALEANTDPTYIKEGAGSKKWKLAINVDADNPTEYIPGAALIYPKLAPNVDLNGYAALSFWAYNEKARTGDQADKPFQIRFFMKGDSEFYYYRIPLDWTGWKQIEVPLDVVRTQKSADGVKAWGPLDYVRFDQAGVGGTTLDPTLNMYLDDIRLTGQGEVDPVDADMPSGEYVNKATVTLSSLSKPSSLTQIYYKRDGVDSDFQLYTAPLELVEDTTLVTKASVGGVDSEETTYRYTFVYRDYVENVTASPPAGTYAESKTVTLSTATEGAAIFYKVEGIDADFRPYSEPIAVDGSQTIVAKAVQDDKTSEETRFAYRIDLSGSSSVPIGDTESFSGWSNTTPVTTPAVLGDQAGQWTDPTAPIDITDVTSAPWQTNDQLEFWLYSDKATNKKVYVILSTPDDSVEGNEYFMSSFFVDWTGWQKIELPFNKFLNSNGGADLSHLTKLIIHPRWYDSDPAPSPDDKLVFDGLALTKNAVEPSIRAIDKSALPDSTLHYSFSLKNIGDADTAYGLTLSTPFGDGYDTVFPASTEVVAKGKETDVDVEVKVPSSAQVGDSLQAALNVKPLQGGKETTVEMKLKVGEPRQATMQHPYVMLSSEQLEQAKQKIEKYGWAQDYLAAIRLKADEWVDKTVYYPSKPGGESTLYVCGDTPLEFDYDKPHKHLCPTDGQWLTGDDLDAAWRFTAHTVNIEAARNLAMVYALTGESKYAQKAKEILINYAELYPSYPLQPLNGRIYYQSLDEAVQIIELAQAYDLIEPSGVMNEAEKYDVEQNLFAPSAKTLQGYDVGKSNWQTWHNAAIGTIGALLEDKTLMDFSVSGRSGFNFQMDNSVLSDGFWYEGAIGYHFYAQSALFDHAQALRSMGYDLFANPNFRKMYDVTLQYAFPDLGIINGNDSGKYPTSLAAPGRVVPMDYEAVYAYYDDPTYGALLDKLYTDDKRVRGGFVVPGDSSSGIAGEQAVFYGKDVIPSGGSLPSASLNFTGIGHSVLRAGEGDDQLYALVDYGKHGGYHGHPDKLHLEIFGEGERLAPDLGIPPYSNSMYESYYKKSFAHNTVLVDGDTQQIPTDESGAETYEPTKLFLQSEPFKIMTNTSSQAYAGMNRYERTVAVTGDYLIDLFDVASDTEHQYDWVLHGMGTFAPGSDLAPLTEPLGTKDAYPFFRNGKGADVSGLWTGAWTTAAGNGLKLFSLTGSPDTASQIIVGEAPGPGNATNVYTPTLVDRVNAKSAQFVSVLEPYRGASKIESVRKTDDGRIEVKLLDGRTQTFFYRDGEEQAGQVQYYFFDGSQYTAENVRLEADWQDGVLSLSSNEWNGLASMTAVVYAPDATVVKWNGKAVDFTSDNGFVMASVTYAPAEPPTNPPTNPPTTGQTTSPADEGRVEEQVPAGESAELSLGEEMTLVVPAGAVGEAVRYVVRKVEDQADLDRLLQGGMEALSSIFEVTKDRAGTFNVPIKLRFAFDSSKLGAGEKPSVYYYNEDEKRWVEMGGTATGSVIEVESNHLTKFAVFAASAQARPGFPDAEGHWAADAIRKAVDAGIVKGYIDGTFKPDRSVTRAEFAVMLMNALQPGAQPSELPDFADSGSIGAWARPAIALAVKAGILHGYADGTIRPNEELTRAQLAVLLANALEAAGGSAEDSAMDFADGASIPKWAVEAARNVQASGLMTGKPGRRFEPDGIVSRAEAVTVMVRLMEDRGLGSPSQSGLTNP